ncbi:hypothetical protein DXG03_004992 [Asterophora parasitica]|uniref:Acyl-CoA dehydrogenase n=1 Tax=Asterophora parasitica TaxID=117018 RepID=A0A9P7KFC5_9AGAR|nr:hypothetical protein DXG03_004992 [Asterophora parasitica]
MRVEDGFQPIPFTEDNPYTSDPVLPSLLKRIIPPRAFKEIEPDLIRLGGNVITTIRAMGSGTRISAPTLTQYDQWGRRVDVLETSEGWRDLKAVSQREGIPGIFYERTYGEHSRAYGFAKVLLMVGDAHVVFCPLSMTDGTARVIELLGSQEMKEKLLPRLISRDPAVAFTSGQWMTERPGGSDVSQTETIATPITASKSGSDDAFGPTYTLDGFKWFSSATDSHISVALARTGPASSGSRGLSLFLVPLRLPLLPPFPSPSSSSPSLIPPPPPPPPPSSTSNNIHVHRLKSKFGTHALPTAELSLQHTTAYLIGAPNHGVKSITPVLNITRLWSAIASVGALRRCLAIATSYAGVRTISSGGAGTRLLRDAPLHVSQLAQISLVYRAIVHLTFGVVGLLGKVEVGCACAEEGRRLRMLTPTAKAFAAEKAAGAMEEAMTTLGGAGYMEENAFGRLIRDGLVEKIWEGTTTVLALDLARAAADPATLDSFLSWAQNILSTTPPSLLPSLRDALSLLQTALSELQASLGAKPIAPLTPRPALILTGYIASSAFLLEHAVWAWGGGEEGPEERDVHVEVFRRWVLEGGVAPAVEDLRRAREDGEGSKGVRVRDNERIVFGRVRPKL